MTTRPFENRQSAAASATESASPWEPFLVFPFTVLWTANFVSNIGSWMYNAASGWLMTSLAPNPFFVSLVQACATLPMFLLALPAGALADLGDRRRLLIAVNVASTLVGLVFAALVWLAAVTAPILLLFAFLIGVGGVLGAPAWQAIVPQLVPKRILAPAVTANGVGFNLSRAIGPAIGGALIGACGIAAPFWINALSNLAVVGALLWWKPPAKPGSDLPPERFWRSISAGIAYSRHSPRMGTAMIRGLGFFFFAIAYWALLPLLARDRIAGGPDLYGILLGTIGAGAVATAFLMPWLKAKLGGDLLVATGTIGTVAALVLFGLARESAVAILASLIAGASWIAVLATLNVAAQVALPEWVRGRGIAIYLTTTFGAMTFGSVAWGKIAGWVGLPAALFTAAAGALVVVALTRNWRLPAGDGPDLAPSLHWPAPLMTLKVDRDRGPVMVTVEYRIDSKDRTAFLSAVHRLGRERRRDGAYAWELFEDTTEAGQFVETFFVVSWLEHLRQHERVTNADRVLQEGVSRLHLTGAPRVRHFVAASAEVMEQSP
jgi:MFS family permease